MEIRNKHTASDIQLFSRPLIIGASISAGYGTGDGGPGAVLARMINPNAKITNIARSGATSVQSTSHVDFDSYSPSIVMGFDLFFWDAAREQVNTKFEQNTRKIFKSFQDRKIPMIIGKIPVVDLPFGLKAAGIKKSSEKVNALLEELCTLKKNSLLYDPLEVFMRMDSDEYFSDNLHLTTKGNQFCASFLAQSGIYKKLEVA